MLYVNSATADEGYTISEAEATKSDVYEYSDEGDIYTLVTDASTLAVGDKVIIVAQNAAYAMSTTQNSNNRGSAPITKNDSTIDINNNADVQVFTLAEGTTTGTFAFNTGSGYIYAASSSSNYLKTETTLDDNGSWTITIASDAATITAQGTNTRNILKYNSSSQIFSCYSSGQQAVQIYKK